MEYVLLIFTGSNFPVAQLPEGVLWISYALPLTRSIAAARGMVNGMEFHQVLVVLGQEVFVGIAYILLAAALVKYAERIAIKKGTLELF
jgi:ABC-2 type transport system permease protein